MRLPGWEVRLEQLINERMHARFLWGRNDCAMFAADGVLAITGKDLAEDIRGTYWDEEGAGAVIEGGFGLTAIVDSKLQRIPTCRATVGDVGLVRNNNKELLALCTGPYWHAPGAWGLVVLPFNAAVAAWHA